MDTKGISEPPVTNDLDASPDPGSMGIKVVATKNFTVGIILAQPAQSLELTIEGARKLAKALRVYANRVERAERMMNGTLKSKESQR